MGKVVYVTGAPATGKSTLCEALAVNPSIQLFCYSQRLRDHVNRQAGAGLGEVAIRRESARAVTSQHVAEVDALLQQEADACRDTDKILLIDSHPVTKESYGFRVTPFTLERLLDLKIDRLVCLYADPAVPAERIRSDPQGRPLPSPYELALHVQLQASLVSTYSLLGGQACHLFDSGVPRPELIQNVKHVIGLSLAAGANHGSA